MERQLNDRPYLSDPYTVSFEASIVSCVSRQGGNYDVILDASYFYPESGGQLADTGMLGDAHVLAVREAGDGGVVHEVDAPLTESTVRGVVDWRTRFDHMQQHSGQHILSRAFIEACRAETVSFHMGDESCTIDLAAAECSDESLAAAELLANTIIQENRNIRVVTKAPEDIDAEAVRKALPPGVRLVRLVEVEGFDMCPCCGTHVRRTGELGAIKILRSEKAKGQLRIHFKSGMRAIDDYRRKHAVASALSNRLTTSVENLPEAVEKLASDNRDLRKSLQKSNRQLIMNDKERLIAGAVEHEGKRYVVAKLERAEPDYLKALSSAFKSEQGYLVFLASDRGAVVCNASTDIIIDLAAILVGAAQRAGGGGGGSGTFASVHLPPSADIDQFLKEVFEHAKSCV